MIIILIMIICFLQQKMPPELWMFRDRRMLFNPRPQIHSASEAERTERCQLTSELLYHPELRAWPLNKRSELLYDPELRGGVMD